MPRVYKRKTEKIWAEEHIKNALEEVARGASCRSVAVKYGVSDTM